MAVDGASRSRSSGLPGGFGGSGGSFAASRSPQLFGVWSFLFRRAKRWNCSNVSTALPLCFFLWVRAVPNDQATRASHNRIPRIYKNHGAFVINRCNLEKAEVVHCHHMGMGCDPPCSPDHHAANDRHQVPTSQPASTNESTNQPTSQAKPSQAMLYPQVISGALPWHAPAFLCLLCKTSR